MRTDGPAHLIFECRDLTLGHTCTTLQLCCCCLYRVDVFIHRVGAINDAFCVRFIVSSGGPFVSWHAQSDTNFRDNASFSH